MRWTLFRVALISLVLSTIILAQDRNLPTQEKAVVEILSFKIGSNYNPLLDSQPSIFAADTADIPQTEAEKLARRNAANANNSNAGRRTTAAPVAPVSETRANGRLRSTIRVIDMAEWVNLSLKNNSDKIIQSIEWDFSFPRYENGKLLLRSDVISKAEIKPGAKKSLKQKLPPDAKKCQLVSAETVGLEMVCGKGFDDPSKIKQEVVTIKKIIYADGSAWERH